MKHRQLVWLGLVCATLALGCGNDDDGGDVDSGGSDIDATVAIDAEIPDAEQPDAMSCDIAPFGLIGGPCDMDADCGFGGFCLDEDDGGPFRFPAGGYCTKQCLNQNDCGDGNFCSDNIFGGMGGAPPSDAAPPMLRLCMPECCLGASCPAGQLCADTIGGFFPLNADACLPGDPTATDGDSCASIGDCNASSFCQNNPFNAPGGACLTVGCTLGDDSTCAPGGDGTCVDFGTIAACVEACVLNSDCNTLAGWECQDIGMGIGSICIFPAARAGDPCTLDTDCGPATTGWTCLTSGYPGGYCSATACDPADPQTCPEDSICIVPGGAQPNWCAATCDPAGPPCRTNYSCNQIAGQDFACEPN